MDFELFIYNPYNYSIMTGKLFEIIKKIIHFDSNIIEDNDATYITCEYFTIILFRDLDLDYVREQYSININYCIDIQMFSKTYEEGIPLIFKIIGNIINELNGDLLFTGNGSIELIKNNQEGLFVSNNSFYNFELPFDEIGISYELTNAKY